MKCYASVFFSRIQMRYGEFWGPIRPDLTESIAGEMFEFLFDDAEGLTQVDGRAGSIVDSLTLMTNQQTFPQVGGNGGYPLSVTGAGYVLYISGSQYEWRNCLHFSQVRFYFEHC